MVFAVVAFVLGHLATENVDPMFFIDVLQACYCNRFKQQNGEWEGQ